MDGEKEQIFKVTVQCHAIGLLYVSLKKIVRVWSSNNLQSYYIILSLFEVSLSPLGFFCLSTVVLVTGAGGFIATHIVKQLQEEGYRVRGTVRSLEDEERVKKLKELCPDAKHELELVEADLTKPESWEPWVILDPLRNYLQLYERQQQVNTKGKVYYVIDK